MDVNFREERKAFLELRLLELEKNRKITSDELEILELEDLKISRLDEMVKLAQAFLVQYFPNNADANIRFYKDGSGAFYLNLIDTESSGTFYKTKDGIYHMWEIRST